MSSDKRIDGMLGVTYASDIASDERYLEYLWISARARGSGVATRLIHGTLEQLKTNGITAVWLWILDGNEPARRLYEKCGFVSTRERQPLQSDPSHDEERMRITINLPPQGCAEALFQGRPAGHRILVHGIHIQMRSKIR